jgi:hypothetical protein
MVTIGLPKVTRAKDGWYTCSCGKYIGGGETQKIAISNWRNAKQSLSSPAIKNDNRDLDSVENLHTSCIK